jgi:hypothetical protein
MSNDPLARSDFWAGAPSETEYEALYAAVTATERGRWFLAEFASHNRHAETDRVVAAIARIEAAVGGKAPPHRADAATDRGPDIGVVAERMSDIAIGLRERGADEGLCDALDAAVREISGAGIAPRPREEAALPAEAVEGRADDEAIPEGAFFNMELQESRKFADAVAALAASLNETPDDFVLGASSENTASEAATPSNDFESASALPAEPQVRRWHIEGPDFVFLPPARERTAVAVVASEAIAEPDSLLPTAELQADPDDDPAGLFDLDLDSDVVTAGEGSPVEESPPPQIVKKTPMRPAPRPVSDPLAAIRALGEDELNALFG